MKRFLVSLAFLGFFLPPPAIADNQASLDKQELMAEVAAFMTPT